MSFTQGFEKTAGLAGMGKFFGKQFSGATTAVKNTTSAITKPINNLKKGFVEGMRGEGKKQIGSGAEAGKLRKAMGQSGLGTGQQGPLSAQGAETMAAKSKPSRGDALSRKSRLDEFKANKGKNWFQKNPIKSTVGAYIGAKHLMGGNQDQPPAPPQVVQY